MRSWFVAGLFATSACGDNIPAIGPPLAPAEVMFVVAHMDDDTIFMQPEVVHAVRTRSVTTVFVASGDPVRGDDRAEELFRFAMLGYAAVAGSSNWACGYVMVEGAPIHHCRLRDRPISLIGLDLPDGGIEGLRRESLLHLVDGTVSSLPILGPVGGTATIETITASIASIIRATAPAEIHMLDLTATHGRDHSSHLLSASFGFWGTAQSGYSGPLQWHRGYNVADELITLTGPEYDDAKWMLGYFEACYFDCGECGDRCTTLDPTHEAWLRRQYASTRRPSAAGSLVIDSWCVAVTTSGALELASCENAAPFELFPNGWLATSNMCLASAVDDSVALEECAQVPGQYWALDDEGMLLNGRPPQGGSDMAYDHVRCLAADARFGGSLTAPTCGARLHPRWQFVR